METVGERVQATYIISKKVCGGASRKGATEASVKQVGKELQQARTNSREIKQEPYGTLQSLRKVEKVRTVEKLLKLEATYQDESWIEVYERKRKGENLEIPRSWR